MDWRTILGDKTEYMNVGFTLLLRDDDFFFCSSFYSVCTIFSKDLTSNEHYAHPEETRMTTMLKKRGISFKFKVAKSGLVIHNDAITPKSYPPIRVQTGNLPSN